MLDNAKKPFWLSRLLRSNAKNSEIGAPLIYWLLKGALPIESVLGMVVKAGYATAMSQKADSVDLI